ncbi:MAG: PQQ-binding-like beta-propeller repeat protein, partial [Candidatus Aenigmatarchaeota archaeon]
MQRIGAFTLFFLILILPALVHAAESMTMIQSGISGGVTVKDITKADIDGSGDDEMLIGTSTGLYIISSDGHLYRYIQTSSAVTNAVPIDDINGDGTHEIVISTSDLYFPNVQCYDAATGEKLWDFSPRTEVYDTYILWTMKQTGVFDLLSMADINGDGSRDIVTSAGYVVYALDGSSGGEIWKYQDTDNVWDLDIVSGDVIGGDQNGYVFLLESGSGKEIWRKLVSRDYTVVNPSTNSVAGNVKRSVWDILPLEVGGVLRAAVSAEDGFVYMLDVSNGEVLWEKEVIDYVDSLLYGYYGDTPIPTSSAGYNFFNLRLTPVNDVTGDGSSDLVASTFPGVRRGREYKGVSGMYLLNSGNGNMEWENENTALSFTGRPVTVDLGEEYIAVPAGKSGDRERIRFIDPSDGTTFDTMSINSSSGQTRSATYIIKSWDEDRFIFASATDDLILAEYPDDYTWRYPRTNDVIILKADFTGDSAPDMLVKTRDGADRENSFDEGKSRSLFVIDGSTKDVAWTYEMDTEVFLHSGGLAGVKVTPDLNGDGKADIAGYMNYFADWDRGDVYGEHSRVVVFSGRTGKKLMDEPPVLADYYGVYERAFTDTVFLNESMNDLLLMEWGLSPKAYEELVYSQKRQFKQ